MESFYHFDKIHSNKENLFIPLSFAIIPAILLNWNKIDNIIVIIAAITSIAIYIYHCLVCKRFARIQFRIFKNLNNKEFYKKIIKENKKYVNIARLRMLLGILLSIIWIGLIICKINQIYCH